MPPELNSSSWKMGPSGFEQRTDDHRLSNIGILPQRDLVRANGWFEISTSPVGRSVRFGILYTTEIRGIGGTMNEA